MILDYLQYRLGSRNKHGVHSPFVYRLVTEVIDAKESFPEQQPIEALRNSLRKDERMLEIEDQGAGSRVMKGRKRKVKDIARYSLKSKKYAFLLYRIVKYFQPENILELGTSFGITTLYMAAAQQHGRITTIEGNSKVAEIAAGSFDSMDRRDIVLINDSFENALPRYLEKNSPDLVFFDGNHSRESTLTYFRQCLQKIRNDSVFIFDDIYWSEGMKEAWKEIKEQEEVRVTVDLFFMGLVFFRKEQEKEHFKIKF